MADYVGLLSPTVLHVQRSTSEAHMALQKNSMATGRQHTKNFWWHRRTGQQRPIPTCTQTSHKQATSALPETTGFVDATSVGAPNILPWWGQPSTTQHVCTKDVNAGCSTVGTPNVGATSHLTATQCPNNQLHSIYATVITTGTSGWQYPARIIQGPWHASQAELHVSLSWPA